MHLSKSNWAGRGGVFGLPGRMTLAAVKGVFVSGPPAWAFLFLAFGLATSVAEEARINLALAKPYTLSPKPNYAGCTDPGDATQLTDGKLVSGYFWTQMGTVGWNGYYHVEVTIDLGQVQPVDGVSFHTAAGTAGVKLPAAIYVLVSSDGQNYFPVGDIAAHAPAGGPGDAEHPVWFQADHLQTHGRYVRLLVVPGTGSDLVFCDEVQVWRGEDALLTRPYRGQAFLTSSGFLSAVGVKRRWTMDLADLKSRVAQSRISPSISKALEVEVNRLGQEIDRTPWPTLPTSFKTILPYGDFHRELFRLNARLLAAQGWKGLVVWNKHRYAPLGLLEPPTRKLKALTVQMLNDECRAEVINVTNASQRDGTVQLQINGLPGGLNPAFVTVWSVAWWDTREGVPLLEPLIAPSRQGDWYEFSAPAGMTCQIWLSFRPHGLAAKSFNGEVILHKSDGDQAIPLQLQIAPWILSEQSRLDFGMWDYSAGRGAYAITPDNRDLAMADLKAHGVTMPAAADWTVINLVAGDFDTAGNLVKAPDFQAFDAWVKEWPEARQYYVFYSASAGLLRFKAGTPGFTRAVGQWAKAWADHNRQIGLRPKQVVFHVVDEPRSPAAFEMFGTWAKAIETGTNELSLFTNPISEGTQLPTQESKVLAGADLICPFLPGYLQGGEQAQQFYDQFKAQGKSVRIYDMFWPGTHDPTACQRLLPWFCYARGLSGLGFWSYANGPTTDVWNDYVRANVNYSPVFIEAHAITTSKHWEALREGLEDYQYLRLLQQVVANTLARDPGSPPALAAQGFLDNIETGVIDRYLKDRSLLGSDAAHWDGAREAALPDAARLEVLHYLASLAAGR